MNENLDQWTYGCEHEFADWDRNIPLPAGITIDTHERTMGNSCGSAVDNTGRYTRHGGEFLTAPSDFYCQLTQLETILNTYPNARPNNRSGLHVHIHVPGLATDLDALKRVQRYVHSCPGWPALLDPITEPDVTGWTGQAIVGMKRRYRRLRAAHHSMVTDWRVWEQMKANTVEQFFEAEVMGSAGPIWHLIRSCVNLRHLRQTETIEFRHWFATTDVGQVERCMKWCHAFLYNALFDGPSIKDMLVAWGGGAPECKPYIHWQDERFWATTLDGSIPREVALANLKLIEDGRYLTGPEVPGAELRAWTDDQLKDWSE